LNFLVDAQLPRRLALWLNSQGHQALHTLDLPLKNHTSDGEILTLADAQDRVVITKDADFFDSWLINSQPRRLLIVATGNIGNDELLVLFSAHLKELISLFESHHVIELGRGAIITRA
jgi:predicted nuclease of predicted toxin-antitoxin system